jgi:hypothetical protein
MTLLSITSQLYKQSPEGWAHEDNCHTLFDHTAAMT